jgi:Lipocalin-like domain
MKIKILFIFVLLFAISCDDEPKDKVIVGFWQLKTVKTNQNISEPEQYKMAMDQLIRTTSIQFNEDKSFGGTIWGDTSFGYWHIKKDSLIINDLSNKIEFSVFIAELNPNTLIIQETVDSVVEIFTFVK